MPLVQISNNCAIIKRNKLDISYPLVHIAVEAYYLFITVRYRCLQKFSIVPVVVEQNANYF